MTESKYLNTDILDESLDLAFQGISANATELANLRTRVAARKRSPRRR